MKIRRSKQILKWYLVYGLMLAASVLQPGLARADSEMRFHGTLIAASCTADATNVEFGEVSLDSISAVRSSAQRGKSVRATGTNIAQFSITLNCTGNINEMNYKWSGTTATFDNTLLATDVPGLGIQIGDGDSFSAMPPDLWFQLDPNARTKKMIAILMRDSGATFAGGEFNATATLSIQVP